MLDLTANNNNLNDRIILHETAGGAKRLLNTAAPLISGASVGWENIKLEHHLMSPMIVPGVGFSDYSLCLEINSAPTAEEVRFKQRTNKFPTDLGEIGIVPPLSEFAEHSWSEHLELLYLHIEPEFVARMAEETGFSRRAEIVLQLSAFDRTLQYLMLTLKNELEENSPNGAMFVETMTTALAIHLFKNYSSADKIPTFKNGGLPPRSLRLVLDYLHDNLGSEIKLEDLARLAGLNMFYFARCFKQSTGLPPHRYLLAERLKLSRRMLAETDLPLAEIALKIGFSSQSHFTEAFRRQLKTTPKKYRTLL